MKKDALTLAQEYAAEINKPMASWGSQEIEGFSHKLAFERKMEGREE